jgi:alpha-D-ribose 1-methylphosphonate 5-triphosphate synthase subunit PhnI
MTCARVPRRGERVRVNGQQGTFVVVRVDKVENVGKLELWESPKHVLWDVPFDAIQLIRKPETQAA